MENKLVVCIMGQDCEDYLRMCLPSVDAADALVFCDGGSKDQSRELALQAGAEIIEQTYSQTDPFMNGKQRNFYLEYLKKNHAGKWCLCLDADEVVDNIHALQANLKTLGKDTLYSVKMRHFQGDLGHEDATREIHHVPHRLFFIREGIEYPLGEHIILDSVEKKSSTFDKITIWHLAYAPLFHVRKRFLKNMGHSNVHSKDFLFAWYQAHIFGTYPRNSLPAREIPTSILKFYCIDPELVYFNGRGFEEKHHLMVKQWADYFKPKEVLDLGCGRGPYLLAWSSHDIPVLRGIEISPLAVKNALHPRVEQGDICTADLRHNIVPRIKGIGGSVENTWDVLRWDLITCIDVLEHLDDTQLLQALQNMKGKGRNYLFSIPFEGDPNLYRDATHRQFKSKEEWLNLLASALNVTMYEAPKDWLFAHQLLIGVEK